MKTLSEIENNIINKLHGVKLEYSRLIEDGQKYIHDKKFNQRFAGMTACGFIYSFTETEIPEVYIRGIFYIPTEKPTDYEQYYKEIVVNGKTIGGAAIPKEVLIFTGSSDGVNADYIIPVFPPYLSTETMDDIMDKITN